MTGQKWKLPSPLPPLAYGDLIQLFLDTGVRPPKHSRLGTPWSIKDLAAEINRSPRQLLNIRRGSNLPHPQTHEFIVQAFCGRTLTTYPEIREALSEAYRQALGASDRPAEPEPKRGSGTSVPPCQQPLPKHFPVRVPTFFRGRNETLEVLHQTLEHGVGRAIVVGPHGVGKTSLAACYAHTFREHYDAIGWIDARTIDTTRQGLLSFGNAMRWSGSDATVASVLDRVAASSLRILLVYDNAGNPILLNGMIPNGNVRLLLTSNYQSWSHEGRVVPLAPWGVESAVDYLTDRLQTCSRNAAANLATKLHGLPLGLDLAATFCERRQLSIDDYNRLLAADPGKALPVTMPLPNYPVHFIDVVRLARRAAEAEAPGANSVLDVLSALEQESLPEAFLIEGRAAFVALGTASLTSDGMQHIIDTLCTWSLIARRTEQDRERDGSFTSIVAHFLTTIAIRADIADLALVRQAAAMLLADGLPKNLSGPSSRYGVVQRVAFHCAALSADGKPTREIMRLHQQLAAAWVRLSRHSVAFTHARRAHVMACRLGLRTDPDVLLNAALMGKACFGYQSRRNRTARTLLDAALQQMQIVLPPFHPAVATTALDLADVCILLDDPSTADQLREMVFRQRHAFWPRSLAGSADAYAALGATYARLSNAERAVPLLCRALVEQVEGGGWRYVYRHDAAETLYNLYVAKGTMDATEAITDFALPVLSRHRPRPDYTVALAMLAIAERANRGFPKLAITYATRALPQLPINSNERFYAYRILLTNSTSKAGILYLARTAVDEARAAGRHIFATVFARYVLDNLGSRSAELNERFALIREFFPNDPSVNACASNAETIETPGEKPD